MIRRFQTCRSTWNVLNPSLNRYPNNQSTSSPDLKEERVWERWNSSEQERDFLLMPFQKKKLRYFKLLDVTTMFPSPGCLSGHACRLACQPETHSRPQRPRPTWSAPRIATSDWLRIRNKCYAHAHKIGPDQRSRFLVPTKRSAVASFLCIFVTDL